ncbi:MAG: 23S rRNA (uracil(1939)-C(5))-methyltransferase RlmD [Candidatus Margulisiibacteriota bacterium]|jgi:23S rRNA (uracil-5-)-methyltransferase RumA
MTALPKKDQRLTVSITELAYGGEGVGRVDGFVVFVPWAVPGDVVEVSVVQRKRSYCRGKIERFVEKSALRVEPPCPYFSRCGGCRWQNLSYDDQLKFKKLILKNELKKELELIPAPEALHYRNKMEFTFGEGPDGLLLGLHKAGDFSQIVDLESCLLHTREADRIFQVARKFFQEKYRQGLSVYNKHNHQGFLRYLILRSTQGKVLINLVGSNSDLPAAVQNEFVELMKALPEAAGIIYSVSSSTSDAIKVDEEKLLWGKDVLQEKIGEIVYNIHSRTFFQTNSAGTRILYDLVREYALQAIAKNNNNKPVMLDLYCGVGSIGLYLADLAKNVIGVELVDEAIAQAKENAWTNGLKNTKFYAGDVGDWLNERTEVRFRENIPIHMEKIDILIIDPPRSGMTTKAIKRLLAVKARHIIYVSCNPTTMARDLQNMQDAGYEIQAQKGVDMFPQTYHMECVVLLERI